MLSCTSCHAALSITFPSGLSAEAMETICAAYRQQLSTAHKPDCSFRLLADQYLRRVEEPPVTIPLAFASVFPTDLVQIMEHPFPSQLLSNQIRKIQDVCPSLWEFPELEIAHEIQSFQPQEDHQKTAVEVITNLVDRFGTNSISVGWLAILGWTPIHAKAELDLESQNPMVSLGCPMCMSIMELSLCKSTSTRNNQEENSRPSKRQKRLARFCNPYDAHRHYCPFKCGFPTRMLLGGTPLWQVLISRFISEQDDKETDNVDDDDDDTSREKVLDPEKAVARIREILFSGLVPKKVSLDMDEEHDEEG